jgi:MraZ protein
MFIGEYSVTLGDKNRLAIPKKLRDQMSGLFFLTRGYENCLILVDSARWDKLNEEFNKKSLLSLTVRDTKRFILGGAVEIEADSQGRFVLPDSLRNFSKIDSKVVFLGVGEWVEVWSEEAWLMKLDDLSKNVSDLAERL